MGTVATMCTMYSLEIRMRPAPSRPSRCLRQRGQAMIEYVVICFVLATCLFAAQAPAGKQLAQAIHDFYADLTLFLSLP